MVELKAKIDTFKSDDGSVCFTQCCLIFGDVTVGDYGQLMLAGALYGALNDLFERAKVSEPIQMTVDQLKAKVQEAEADIRNSYLPIGVEGFDGDFVGLVKIDGHESVVVRLWGGEDLFLLDISRSDYIKFMRDLRKTLAEQCKALGLNLDRDSACVQ
ncbi:hypothetical protein [Pseudomonas sichuanensis]|uniref:hypothetical protein n=1 Tax=Pseudomonas sichuanensis TaxID=2213015 RepID=UPI000DA6C174|nr:hypothetical protein [Pseudomonas sichuanensis]